MITDLPGREYSFKVNGNHIDVSALDAGFFILIIITGDNNLLTQRFIKL
jgi:hypothetical protein